MSLADADELSELPSLVKWDDKQKHPSPSPAIPSSNPSSNPPPDPWIPPNPAPLRRRRCWGRPWGTLRGVPCADSRRRGCGLRPAAVRAARRGGGAAGGGGAAAAADVLGGAVPRDRGDTDFKNHNLPLARIKKIMKADEDVRMIAAEAPVVFARACEMFILELTHRGWAHAEENKRRTLQKSDIAAAIARTEVFDFLVDIVPRDDAKDADAAAAAAAAAGCRDSSPCRWSAGH
ncbi:hypothetical protein GUJ93_ZPchr0009g1926 [Zizania palustris]|uniref:Transcription factor CBF/NF-Y/archaeal histone domain-containing protein n=1 Tax=Zizania palustris TaxID=103762 RepID=A0A8J5RU51_ZIZPA|nr:hypothetical protein GUJ93_ZPchr0009g1926 [Zizania palustris]